MNGVAAASAARLAIATHDLNASGKTFAYRALGCVVGASSRVILVLVRTLRMVASQSSSP